MKAIDQILKASQQRVAESGMLSEQIRMGVVSAVGTDGTITVAVDTSVFPKVRLLQSVQTPVIGDRVEIANTLGGWVCVGALRGNNAPRIQSGKVSASTATANQWVDTVVTFPTPFSTTPRVVASPTSTINAGTELKAIVANESTTGFTVRVWRGNSTTPTSVNWIATDF